MAALTPWQREVRDQAAHVAASLPFAAAAVYVSDPIAIAALTAIWAGILREDVSHRIRGDDGWMWPLRGWRRWLDVAAFGVGGAGLAAVLR
ncbi:MAG: hypothetical protein HKN04_11915 [Rhodothermaceae bacterium]|nr:hypothetical protein [Rhodothermaceae bacterium]